MSGGGGEDGETEGRRLDLRSAGEKASLGFVGESFDGIVGVGALAVERG